MEKVLSSFRSLLAVLLLVPTAEATASALHASVRQADYSTRIGEPLAVVAEMTATKDLKGCSVRLATSAPVGLSYQFTDGQGGPRIGEVNKPVDLQVRTPQALLLIITPRVLLDTTQLKLHFECADGTRAEVLPDINTLSLTVNAPLLEKNWARGDSRRDCQPWSVEHVYLHFDNTLLVRLTAARLDDTPPPIFPKLGSVTIDYEVEEVLRGSSDAVSGIAGPLSIGGYTINTVIPLGKRFIVSGDQGTIRWEQCSKYWMVPLEEANDCQLYRYRRLASDAAPYNARCEAASIASYLDRLNVTSTTPKGEDRLSALKGIWYRATGHQWDGKSVPNKILYQKPYESPADFSHRGSEP